MLKCCYTFSIIGLVIEIKAGKCIDFGCSYGAFAVQGTGRPQMEDTYSIAIDSEGSEPSFFGVFDGHGGTAVAEYAIHACIFRFSGQKMPVKYDSRHYQKNK
jgi:serine/threonine protein phosphatase PrpC